MHNINHTNCANDCFFLLVDIVLIAIFSLSLKAWAFVILWFTLAPVAHKWDLGPIYVRLVTQLCDLLFSVLMILRLLLMVEGDMDKT